MQQSQWLQWLQRQQRLQRNGCNGCKPYNGCNGCSGCNCLAFEIWVCCRKQTQIWSARKAPSPLVCTSPRFDGKKKEEKKMEKRNRRRGTKEQFNADCQHGFNWENSTTRGGVLILPQGRPPWGGIKSGADNPSTAHTIQRGDQTGVPYGFSVKPEIQHVKRGWQDPHFS